MEPADILSQIKPCDMENPYIFISYSAQDHARVWADVLAFQQLGFNVWLDERNLDKTKDSWTEDALSAIRGRFGKDAIQLGGFLGNDLGLRGSGNKLEEDDDKQ